MKPTGNGQFGRVADVKSFIDYKASIGRPSKGKLGKGKRKSDEENNTKEVIITIGLMAWDESDDVLKEKRGKRLAIRVPQCSNYTKLLERATDKWKNFQSNLFEEGKEYILLLLEDGQEAQFLPVSGKKAFFTLNRYKEELLRDYKRITLFLCKCEDLLLSERKANDSEEDVDVKPKRQRVESCQFDDMAAPDPSGCSSWVPLSDDHAKELQIKHDEQVALELQKELEEDMSDTERLNVEIKDEASVIYALEKRVIQDGEDSMFIVVGRGAQLERVLSLWQRAAKKKSPDHALRVKFVGEDGIDTGALAKECLL